jgi:pyruvate kinase
MPICSVSNASSSRGLLTTLCTRIARAISSHYLALRGRDIRQLQEELAALGLSSLGRTESHVLAAIEAVLNVVHQLAGQEWRAPAKRECSVGFVEGKSLLHANTDGLLGPPPLKRGVRIMVTMPSEAADDFEIVRQLLANGMDCMRINCAHDDSSAWGCMVAHLQRAKQELGRECRVEMDLTGPKLRTGSRSKRCSSGSVRARRNGPASGRGQAGEFPAACRHFSRYRSGTRHADRKARRADEAI